VPLERWARAARPEGTRGGERARGFASGWIASAGLQRGGSRVFRLYDYLRSGNGYKVRLLLAQLAMPYRLVELDIMTGATRTPEFLAKNPNGRIPLLELEDGTYLPESNAILFYLAEGTPFLSSDPLVRAQTLQWMFFEQYSHEPYIAVLKFWKFWGGLHHKRPDELAHWKQRGQAALAVMNTHLEPRAFFAGERYSIADIALYAYTHTADLAGFNLELVPHVVRWLARVRSQPGHVAIKSGPGSIATPEP
jgi:glutathione S-transferase